MLQIILEGDSEFVAKNVIFSGNIMIHVPDGKRLVASQGADGLVVFEEEDLFSCEKRG